MSSEWRPVQGSNKRIVIQIGIEQLKAYLGTSKQPDDLAWEIRLYQFILDRPDSEAAAAAYLKERFDAAGVPRKKREVARRLGWEIQ